MPIPDIFGPRQQPLTSYSFTDIVGGTGVEDFYAGITGKLSGSLVVSGNVLSNVPFYSSQITSKVNTTATGNYANVLNSSFDLTFNVPRTINGNVIINIPIGMNSLSNTPETHRKFCVVELDRVDSAGAETFLISGQTFAWSNTSDTVDRAYSKIETVSLPLTSQLFKQNEKLRMKLMLYAYSGTATAWSVGFAHDPENRVDNSNATIPVAGSSGPIIASTTNSAAGFWATDTKMLVQIPFKLEVEV